MHRLVLPLLCLLALPAQAQDAWGVPRLTQRHGLTTIIFEGTLPEATRGRKLIARVRRGDETALATPLSVGADGACLLRLRTPRLLLPDRYRLELLSEDAAGEPLWSTPFELGDAAAQAAARERLLAWYRGAAGTFRELSATLERRGGFHHALCAEGGELAALQRGSFSQDFLPEWSKGLRRARMDLATYQRRLLLPPLPQLGNDLLALVDLLRRRQAAWGRALDSSRAAAPPPNAEVEAVAQRVLAALELPAERLADWRAGPLGTPPAPATPGAVYTGALGFRLSIPAGAELLAPTSPVDRLGFKLAGATVIVRVRERPDVETIVQLRRRLEVDAWEQWDSYKRLASQELPAGLRLEFSAQMVQVGGARGTQRGTARIVQRSLAPPQARRSLTLLIIRPEGAPLPEALAELEAGFQVIP